MRNVSIFLKNRDNPRDTQCTKKSYLKIEMRNKLMN